MGALRNGVTRFGQGILLPFRAVRLLATHSALWPLVWAPAMLTSAGLLFGLTIGWSVSGSLLGLLWTHPAIGWFFPALWQLVHVVIYAIGVLFDALALPEILGAPLNDRLSMQIERLALGQAELGSGLTRFAREIAASMAAAAVRLVRFGVIQAALLLLNLFPGGQAVYPFAAFVWGALWLAQQYLDMTMARHLHTPKETRAALRDVRPLALGMGLVLGALFLLPLANLLLVPIGVASGALLYCDLVAEGKLARDEPTR